MVGSLRSVAFRPDLRQTLGRQTGASTIEALTAACVFAVLVSAALPSMSVALDSHRLTAVTNDLLLAVNLARSTATALRKRVVLAPRTGTDWTSGWRIFVDGNGNGALDEGEAVLREFDPAPMGMSITPRFGAYAGALSYDKFGNLRRAGSGGFVLGRLVLANGAGARSLCFSALQVRAVRGEKCA